MGALSNFERKAEPARAVALADNFATARAAVEALQARLREPAGDARGGGGGGGGGDGGGESGSAAGSDAASTPDATVRRSHTWAAGGHESAYELCSDGSGTPPPLPVPEFTFEEPTDAGLAITESAVGEETDGVFEPPPPLGTVHLDDGETVFDDEDPEVFV